MVVQHAIRFVVQNNREKEKGKGKGLRVAFIFIFQNKITPQHATRFAGKGRREKEEGSLGGGVSFEEKGDKYVRWRWEEQGAKCEGQDGMCGKL